MRLRFSPALVLSALLVAACAERDGPTSPGGFPDLGPGGVLAPAAEAQRAHQDDLMAVPGVVGVGLGQTERGGPALIVMTEHDGVRGLPTALGGVPVRVMVTGEIFALQQAQEPRQGPPCGSPPCGGGGGGGDGGEVDPTARFPRPVPIGISTGHPTITAGTIGARVKKGNEVLALSNNHVYAASNAASKGDAVIQPGSFDGGSSPADDIGTLDDFVVINFAGNDNVVDAAIASTTTGDLGNATPSDGYGIPRSQTIAAEVGMRVKKYGRTTGETKGRVSAINATVNVNYGAPGVARFVDQIVVGGGGFSAGGDSGSLVVVQNGSDARRPVGLLYAGSSSATILNPIEEVLNAFGVTIDGE